MRINLSERWRQVALSTLKAAKLLFKDGHYRDCTSRAYYATYQSATSVCVAHGDEKNFPPGWNNPSHEQLPTLILNNGDLTQTTRREVSRLLRILRSARENADYRPGLTVDERTARDCLSAMSSVFQNLQVEEEDG